ncbi:PAS domain-containing sensor histidine kinase [Nitrosomonas sp. ANs5]|uniref:PAS domain-containing sensor histidine kinase n=1 Tax=Nitrosomonas sp. ANs5 TaxID=3423941 RepID=UPI003D336B0D
MYDSEPSVDVDVTGSISGISLHKLFAALPEACLLVDHSGRVLLTNTAVQDLFGYTEAEFCTLEIESLIPARFRKHHRSYVDAYLANPRKRSLGDGKRLIMLRRDGQELMVDIGLSPIVLPTGLCILVTLNAAARRRQAEQALRISEERLLLAKQAAGLGVFDCDCQRRVIYCDERLNEICGNGGGETISHDEFLAIIHPNDRPLFENALEQATNPDGEGRLHVEFRLRPNATNQVGRWVVIVGRVHFKARQATRLVGIVRDITERKIYEKNLLVQRNETETFFRQQVALGTASAIAHQLNSPLTAISIYSEVALRTMQQDPLELDKMKCALEACVMQAQLAGRSLHELLVFLQKGGVQAEVLDLNAIVTDVLKDVRDTELGEFILLPELQANLPAVQANRVHLQKVLLNLIGNAIEAMRAANIAGAAITVRTENLTEQSMARVTVQDNGPGLNQEVARHVFEPFFTTKPTGIGIGLPICHALIEANGGHLWVDPDSRQGARFCFTLPFA